MGTLEPGLWQFCTGGTYSPRPARHEMRAFSAYASEWHVTHREDWEPGYNAGDRVCTTVLCYLLVLRPWVMGSDERDPLRDE